MDTQEDSPSVEEQPVEQSPSSEESSSPPQYAPARTDWQAQQERQQARKLVAPSYNPVEVLLAKLELFLVQQPEWAVVLAAPRATRRKAVSLISKRLLTTPARGSRFGE